MRDKASERKTFSDHMRETNINAKFNQFLLDNALVATIDDSEGTPSLVLSTRAPGGDELLSVGFNLPSYDEAFEQEYE